MKPEIRYAKDFLDASSDQRNTRYLADAAGILLGLEAEPCFENPCVGGSIPPRATKNIPDRTPTLAGWRFCLWMSRSSCPVHFPAFIPQAFLTNAAVMAAALRLQHTHARAMGGSIMHYMRCGTGKPRPTKLAPDTVSDELCSYVASPAFDELLAQLAYGEEQQGAPRNSIAHPLVIGWGRRDRVCFPRQARRALALFPDAQLHWFDRCGHFPHWDAPTETAQLIVRALAGTRANAAAGLTGELTGGLTHGGHGGRPEQSSILQLPQSTGLAC
jgi:pimeloyl-ACP methyl ester carboxylesterase